MDKEIVIAALNDLVEINNDRIVGYETAKKETEDTDLHVLFGKFLLTSERFAAELRVEVMKLGGEKEEGTKASGKLHRLWMDFKAAFKENNRASILSSCEFGDEIAIKTYDETLDANLQNLDPAIQKMIMRQEELLKEEYIELQKLKSLADERK